LTRELIARVSSRKYKEYNHAIKRSQYQIKDDEQLGSQVYGKVCKAIRFEDNKELVRIILLMKASQSKNLTKEIGIFKESNILFV